MCKLQSLEAPKLYSYHTVPFVLVVGTAQLKQSYEKATTATTSHDDDDSSISSRDGCRLTI